MNPLARACLAGSLTATLVLAGCGRSAPWTPTPQAQEAPADDSGYRDPPQVRGIEATPSGPVLSGRAAPKALVRLASPAGGAQTATADDHGAWSLSLGLSRAAAIFGLSQEVDGGRVQAEGYVAVLPGPQPIAAVLRAGAGALVAAGSARAALAAPVLLAADTDGSGVAVVSGLASANQPLRVLVDGAPLAEGAAGSDGRFALSLPKPLAPGARLVEVQSPTGAVQATLAIGPAGPFVGPLRAVSGPHGWRLDWLTPAGGVQTTEIFGGA